MRCFIITALAILCLVQEAHAQSSRHQLDIPFVGSPITIDSFEGCAEPSCPAVLILGGSKGLGAPAYAKIGQTLQTAGLNVHLVHVLTQADIETIAQAGSARARLAYYAKRLPAWTSAVQGALRYVETQPYHGRIGVLGISLGAQIASAASVGRGDVDALVLVDGGLPSSDPPPTRALPPLLLIWGSADQVFPLRVGRNLQQTARRLGGLATLKVYENAAHDFFLQTGASSADEALQAVLEFLRANLSR